MTQAQAKYSRWRKAERENYGFRLTLTLYVPAPPSSRQTPRAIVEAHREITRKVQPILDELKMTVESLNGQTRFYVDV